MGRKILITGGGGYIGSVATYLLLQKGYEVVVIDNFIRGYREPLELLQNKFGKKKLRFYKVDLNSKKQIDKFFALEKGIEAVIHYAAFCLVNESMEFPQKYFSNNVGGTLNLLNALIDNNIDKVVFSSTCAVYGETKYLPVDEEHSCIPTNPYGESKLMVEKMIRWYGERLGINYVILRYFNICGASDDGLIGDSKKPSVLLMQNAVRGAMGIEDFKLTCPKVNTPDGTPIRDYINVVDLNEAHLLALEYLFKGGKSEVINLGTGKGNSVLEIVRAVQKITGKKFVLNKSIPRQGEYAKIYAKNTKAKQILGWSPKRSIIQSVKSLVSWYTNNPKGWKK